MKFSIIIAVPLLVVWLSSCSDRHDPKTHFSQPQADTLLADIITYVYVRPTGADWNTRFNPEFRPYYVKNIPNFKFDKLYRDKSGAYYFFMIRPARSASGTIRGVGGKFTLGEEGRITSFTEVFNTPVGDISEVRKKGYRLYEHMIAKGNVDEYLLNEEYLEWPNAWTYYDTLRHEWLVKPNR